MASDRDDQLQGSRAGIAQLIARAGAANARDEARIRAFAQQLGTAIDLTLDDRARAQVQALLASTLSAVEQEIRGHAARLLAARHLNDLAEIVARAGGDVEATLRAAGLLADVALIAELVDRVTQDRISEALSMAAPDEDDRPGLVLRLATAPDGVVAAAAATYLAAAARRRAPLEAGASVRTDLPAELHQRLVWRVTAAIDAALPALESSGRAAVDRALDDAAMRSLAAHDEGDRLEATAMQLAAAIDAIPAELPDLLVDALQARQLPLFIAVVAHGLAIEQDVVRTITLDPAGDRLWLALRALDLPRAAIARIGLALCDADPRRDVDAFADQLDVIAAVPAQEARIVLAPLRRHAEFRAAAQALARGSAA
jgi:hypothetical protein